MAVRQGRRQRHMRMLAVVLGGGMLMQVGGCIGSFTPVILSLAESSLLSYLFFGGR